MTARVVVDGVPNEPVEHVEFQRMITPILDALGGVSAGDVTSLTITPKEIRAKVAIRNKRGHRVHGSWAHLVRRVDLVEEGTS